MDSDKDKSDEESGEPEVYMVKTGKACPMTKCRKACNFYISLSTSNGSSIITPKTTCHEKGEMLEISSHLPWTKLHLGYWLRNDNRLAFVQ